MNLKWIHCCLGRIVEPVGTSVLWYPPIPFQPTVPLASLLAPQKCRLKTPIRVTSFWCSFYFGKAKHKCQAGLRMSPSRDLCRVMTPRSSQAPDERPMAGISGCLAKLWLHYHNYQCSCRSWDPVNDTALKFWAIYTQRSNFYKVNDLHGTSRWYCSHLLLSMHLWNSSWREFSSFLRTVTSGSSPMSHSHGGGSSQCLHTTFLPYLGEAVIGRLCFSCTRGVMKKKKWGDDFGAKLLAKQWVLGTMCRWFMRARRREWRGRNCPGPLASS